MGLRRWSLLISIVLGLAGGVFLVSAFQQYLKTADAFTQVSVSYVSDSFVWLDSEHHSGRGEVQFNNGSDRDVVVEWFDANLYFDRQFAGAMYTRWTPILVPKGSAMQVVVPVQVSTPGVHAQAGEAQLSLQGRSLFRFSGIRQSLWMSHTLRMGQVTRVEG